MDQVPEKFPTTEELFEQPMLDIDFVHSVPRHAYESKWNSLRRNAFAATLGLVAGIGAAYFSHSFDGSGRAAQEDDTVPEVSAPLTANLWANFSQGDFLKMGSIVVTPNFDLTKYKSGDFIGALVIQPAAYDGSVALSSSETLACEQGQALSADIMGSCFDMLRAAYFEHHGTPNLPKEAISVHRFIAVENEVVADEFLANGPTLITNTDGSINAITWHDITPIDAPIEYDGQEYNQPMMGINSFLPPGSVVKYVLPSNVEGYVYEYDFVVVNYSIVNANDPAAINAFFSPEQGIDAHTSQCWVPGDNALRLNYGLALTGAKTVPGSVSLVGEVKHTAPEVG